MASNFLSALEAAARRRLRPDRRSWLDEKLLLSAKSYMATAEWKEPIRRRLYEKEFKGYSQFGDDGIIQYLVQAVPIRAERFIEFGVGDYFESNTHFLLVNNGWTGLVLDGGEANIDVIRNCPIYWQYDLTAECAFVTRDNVNALLCRPGFDAVGILHIDLDGNDYWVLEALDLEKLQVDVLVLEYNAVFGATRAITVPYDPAFDRSAAHYSLLYWGASLPALVELADDRGFDFVGTNSAGNNAYFVNKALAGSVSAVTAAEGFVDSRFREARDERSRLTYVSGPRRQELIRGLPVRNTRTGAIEPF